MTTGERIRSAVERLGVAGDRAIAELAAEYAEDTEFRDPIQDVFGREAFIAANRRLVRRARTLEMSVLTMLESKEHIFMTWRMRYALKLGGPLVTIEGTTHLELRGGLVTQHRDYWDLLGSFMNALPILGPAYRALVARLG